MSASQQRVTTWAILVLGVAVVALVVVFSASRSSSAARGADSVRSALHPIDVIYAEGRLRRAAGRGASSGRLLTLTNGLLDTIRNDPETARRAAIDDALSTLDGVGCVLCEAALERARP